MASAARFFIWDSPESRRSCTIEAVGASRRVSPPLGIRIRSVQPRMSSQERFVTLDGMRGLAALVVAASHVGELVGLGVPPHAHLAVDFFFVLSGFVIAHAYEHRLATTMRPIDFIRVRVIRLHPLIALGSG